VAPVPPDTVIVGLLVGDLVPHALQLIGVGPGDPELLTIAAVRAIETADVWLIPLLVLMLMGWLGPLPLAGRVQRNGDCLWFFRWWRKPSRD
jgi:hypothetical protein